MTKRFFALLMAVVMVLALSVPAFAEDKTIQISTKENRTPHTYAVYQVFTGDYYEETEGADPGTLSNVKWGSNAKLPSGKNIGDTVDAAVLKTISDLTTKTADTARSIYEEYVDDKNTTAIKTVVEGGDAISVPTGYYVLVDLGVAKDGKYSIPEGDSTSLFIVQVVDDVAVSPKADAPHVDKEIVETNNTKTKVNEVSIGDTVTYEITGTLPSTLGDYEKYYYEFVDTLTAGLTYQKDAKVYTVNGTVKTDVTASFTFDPANGGTVTDPTTVTEIHIECPDVKLIPGVTSTTQFVVEYTAVLNKNAVIAGEGNPNDVLLKYNNNPNKSGEGKNSPTGETPKSTVKTYTTELTIFKTDGTKTLTGAEFELKGEGVNVVIINKESFVKADNGIYYKLKDGTYTTVIPTEENKDKYAAPTTDKYSKKTNVETAQEENNQAVKAEVNADGKVTFTGLGVGTYTITETKTPAGFNTCDPITFTVSFDPSTAKFSADNVILEADNCLSTTVVNLSGSVLPETGGIGTTIFYVVGAVLVVGAAVILFAKKKVEE